MLQVPTHLRQTAHVSEDRWLNSARQLIDLVCRECGIATLSNAAVLDVGCGTKTTKALLDDPIPIGRYVGIDVDADIIDFLRANVDDPRFDYHHIDVRNDLYNPHGLPLSERNDLPLPPAEFDVIWLFSVFTHLAPVDYAAMLRLLRPHIRDDGWLIFSVFINEVTDAGFGPVDQRAAQAATNAAVRKEALTREFTAQVAERGVGWFAERVQDWLETMDDATRAEVEKEWSRHASSADLGEPVDNAVSEPRPEVDRLGFIDESGQFRSDGEPPDYFDLIPEKPLLVPLYSRRHAIELIDGTGWDIVALKPPVQHYIQHYFVCRPA